MTGKMKKLLLLLASLLLCASANAATLYVAPNGSDSNPCTQASPCASFNGARAKAAAGDEIEVAGGSYGSQTITGAVPQVVIRPASGAAVTVANVTVHGSNVEVRDMRATGEVQVKPPNNLWSNPPTNVTVRNFTGLAYHIAGNNISFIGGSYGGFNGCTGPQEDIGQSWQLPDSSGTYHASSNILIDGVVHHDITDNNNTCAGFGDKHVDCLQILAGHFVTVQNSTFYNCATSDIIARPFRDSLNDLTIRNNFMGEVIRPGASLNLGSGDNGGDLIGGNNVIYGNTILGSVAVGCRPAGCLKYYSNILSIGSCGTNVTFEGNVFAQSWSATCGTLAKKAMPSFVGPTPSPSYNNGIRPNYHLSASDTVAIGAGTLTGLYPTDIDGDARPTTSRPDAGADQRGGTPPPPPPPPPPDVVTISIAPTSATVAASATRQFTATVQGNANTVAIWSVGTANCGSVNATGLYTAPGAAATCTVTATSQADTTKAASATVAVTAPPPPPPPPVAPFNVGDRIQVRSNANIRAVATNNGYGTPILAVAPAGSLGTVLAVTTARLPNTTSAVWIQVDFDTASLPTGFMGSDNMTVVSTPPPPPPPPPPALTIDCAAARQAVTATNMPAGTVLTITATAAGITRTCTVQ